MQKTFLYALFAVIATIVNLLSQEAVARVTTHEFELLLSMFIGTGAGLIVKYILDKKYIFCYRVESNSKDFTTFMLYSLMGVLTTLLFWVTEYVFDLWFQTKIMRYTGAVIGLAIGYLTKYWLDKKFVFVDK